MKILHNSHAAMNDGALYAFYTHVVLPQFGIRDVPITWSRSQATGPDETAHYFSLNGIVHALIYEDFDGLGRNDSYIRENVLEKYSDYSFVLPTSESATVPSYDGLCLPTPYEFCFNITGTFTLLELLP